MKNNSKLKINNIPYTVQSARCTLRLALVFVLFALIPTLGFSQTYWTPDDIPVPYLEDNTKYVSNPDSVLSQVAVDSLNAELFKLEKETGIQTVVIVVKHIEGDDPYAFGMAFANKYGIGKKKKDDGLFIMLCNEDRSYTILPGRGLEGTLPDIVCYRIQTRFMVPQLKEGAWDEAMLQTVNAVDQYIRGDEQYKNALDQEDSTDEDDGGAMWAFGMFLLFIGFIIYLIRKGFKRNCPKCGGKGTLRRTSSKVVKDAFGKQKMRITWTCKQCGYTTTEDVDNTGNSSTGGSIVFGGLGGLGGGGGHSGPTGGHFGGGSFGGGGSTGRF